MPRNKKRKSIMIDADFYRLSSFSTIARSDDEYKEAYGFSERDLTDA